MRLPEQKLWDRFRRAISDDILAQRVENLVGQGWPDVLTLGGPDGFVAWVELKAVESKPARASTRVLGDKKGLSRDQRNWFFEWHRFGGNCFVLVAVGREHFLVPGGLADQVNDMTMADLAQVACARTWQEIIERLQDI